MTKSITTVGVRDAIKDILDMATKAVESVNKISDAFGKVGTFGIGAGITSFIKMMANFDKYSGLTGISGTIKNLVTGLSGAFSSIKTDGVTKGFSNIGTSLMGVAKASGLARTATILLNGVLNGIVWAVVIAGIQKAIQAWDDYAHATENAIKASKERQDGYRDEAETYTRQINSLEGLSKEYDTLSQKVNLTGEEYQRLKELKQEIAEIAPELVTGYDVNNDPIISLSGNMDEYIEKIKKARQEKMDLVNYEASLQATEYLKNEKDTQNYKREAQKAIDMINNKNGNSAFMGEGNAWKGTKAIQEAGKEWQNQTNAIKKNIGELVTAHEEYEVANNSIKSSVIRNLGEQSKAYKNLTPQVQSEMNQLVQSLDLGDFTQGQIVELNRGLEGIMENYTNSMATFGSKQQQEIQKTKEAFQNSTGSIEDYGNALMNAFSDKQKINLTELNDYLSAINEQYGNTGNIEQYQNQLRQVAQVISEITGMDYDTLYKGLRDGFNLDALEQSTVALNNYLDKNKQSIDEWSQAVGDGGKKARELLEDNFKGVTDFLQGAFNMGGFDVDYLNQVKDRLPKQLQEIAKGISKDNKATELEQKFMVAVSTEIANEGEVTDDTIKNLEDLLNGVTDQIDIQGYLFKGDEADGIRQLFKDIGWEAKDLKEKLKDNGLKDVLKDAQTLQKELKNLNFDKEVNKKIQGLKFDDIGGLKALEEAIGKFTTKEQQIKFTADCGQFFQEASNMQEAIQNMINSGNGHLILKYDLDVSGDENLQHIKDVYNELPKEIRTLIDTKVIGFDQVVKVKELLIDGGLKDSQITTLMQIKGADEALAKATSLKEFLMLMQDLIVTSQINVETNGTEETEEVITEVQNADGTTSEVKVNMTAEGKEKLELVQKLLNDLDGKETKSNHTSKADNKELDETKKKQEEVKKETKSNHKAKADTKELDEAEKKVEKLTVDTHGLITLQVEGEQQLQATVGEKDKLEVDGKAITYVQIDGKDKYEVSINDKNQLEVNGVAQTDIEVTGGEKLTFSKNEKGELEVNGKGVTNLEVTGTEKLREANEYVEILSTDTYGNVTITVNGEEEIRMTKNEKGQLEADGRAITYVQVEGGEKYSIAINDKGQLEVNGEAKTDVKINNGEELKVTKNDKGQLEVNGQAVTDVVVNGKEEPKEAKKNVDELTKAGNKNVKVNIDVSLKDTVGEILSRLGLNKKTEKVEIQVTCKDEATPVINKITNTNNKQVTVNITCNDQASTIIDKINNTPGTKTINVAINCTNGANVLNTVHQIANTQIPSKQFSVTANTGDVQGRLNAIASTQIPTKQFSIICNDSATGVLSQVKGNNVPDKKFTINCTDNATSVVNKVIGLKIPNKSFTVSCKDSASSTLSSIISKLSSIRSKSVTVTTRYSTIGKPASGTVPSANEPEIIELQQPSFGSGATQSLDAQTQAISNQAQVLSDEVKPLQDNVADVMATKPVKANIDTKSTVTALKYNVDLLNNMTNIISKLSTQISILDSKMERVWGTSKSKLLKDQISLLTKEQGLIKVNIKNMEGMRSSLKSSLSKQGFKFKDDGSISNYNSKLIAMEKNVEKLKKKEEAYTGKSEKTKKKLSNAYNKANDELELTKQKLQEYYNLQFNELPNAQKEWEDLANSIAEAKAEIIRTDREAKTFFEDMREEITQARFDRDNTWADTYILKADLSSWKDAIGYIEKANELLAKNQYEQEILMKNAQSRMKDNKAILDKNGFKYTKTGYLDGAEKTLEKLRKKLSPAEYEAVKEAYDAYVEDMYRTLPEAENQWWKLQQSIEENKKQIEETNKAMQEMIDTANITQLTARYDALSDSLDLVEAKMEGVHGEAKLAYMREEIKLLEQMAGANRQIAQENKALAENYKQQLETFGATFDSQGNITNLKTMLTSQGTLDDMEELQDLVDKYNDSLSETREANKSVIENENSINDLKDSMIELNQEMKELEDQAWAKEFDNSIKIVQNRLDKIDAQLDLQGSNQLELLDEKIKVYEELARATENSLAYQEKKRDELAGTLISYGFTINDDGTISNTAKQLEHLKNTLSESEFEIVSQALEDYFDVALDGIPNLERELLDFQKEMQNVQKEKLERTKDIEEEITKIYEKQIEERIKKIEEESDAQVDALNKAKDAYNRYRDEVDYKDDYEEQLKKVEDLQKKLEIAKRDDSLSGAKRVADLQEQLLEEQKNLEKLVQDKIDNDINNMFDDQIDKIQTDADEEVKNLEDTWTESKIAEAVEQALNTGIFTDIDGNIKSLDSALMEFANNSSEYFGVMGDSLKVELLDNLNIALDTIKEIQGISNNLNSQSVNYNEAIVPKNATINYIPPTSTSQQNTITIGDTVITIQGSADTKTVKEIETMLNGYKQEIYMEIMKNVK